MVTTGESGGWRQQPWREQVAVLSWLRREAVSEVGSADDSKRLVAGQFETSPSCKDLGGDGSTELLGLRLPDQIDDAL